MFVLNYLCEYRQKTIVVSGDNFGHKIENLSYTKKTQLTLCLLICQVPQHTRRRRFLLLFCSSDYLLQTRSLSARNFTIVHIYRFHSRCCNTILYFAENKNSHSIAFHETIGNSVRLKHIFPRSSRLVLAFLPS